MQNCFNVIYQSNVIFRHCYVYNVNVICCSSDAVEPILHIFVHFIFNLKLNLLPVIFIAKFIASNIYQSYVPSLFVKVPFFIKKKL